MSINEELFALSEAEINRHVTMYVEHECQCSDCNCVDDCPGPDGDGNG